MIALFIYGSSTLVDPFNVASLRCAAEFLELNEEYSSSGNLCDHFDIYLNQVVLQNWDDTLIVLQKCQNLLPLAEELLIVSRCIESLALMACMEILDPERRREKPTVTLEALADQQQSWNPVGFYFSLLSLSLELSLRNDSIEKLQQRIVSLLSFARVEDFLLPTNSRESISSSMEVAMMERIFSAYASSLMLPSHTPLSKRTSIVAERWDIYLTEVARDPQLSSKRFAQLVETIPMSIRQTHDHLYRALNTYLMVRHLSCQKLSQEVCIEAAQNELMPLRLIVQALFVQQLNTQAAFKECSDSFRYTHCSEFSGSLSRAANNKSQNLIESPYMNGSEGGSKPLSFLLQKDVPMHGAVFGKAGSSFFRLLLNKCDRQSRDFRFQQ